MNRIVFVTILSCVFLSTALLAQNSPQKLKTGPKPTATEPKPVAANGASTTGPGGLPLRGYKFDVVTVNSSGTGTNRRKGQALCYVEDMSGDRRSPSTGFRVVALARKPPTAALDVEDAPTLYLARVISVDPANRDAYVRWLERSQRSVWQELKRRGYLADATVFELTKVLVSGSAVPSWNFLLLAHIASGVTVAVYLQAEREVELSTRHDGVAADSVPFAMRRVEVLRSTPNSYYPVPAASNRNREAEAEFLIEYIAVQNTPTALDEYRESMRVSIGPEIGERVRNGRGFSFFALETVSVEFAEAGMPNWNQIHVSGLLPRRPDEPHPPWPPAAAAVLGKLESIRTKPRIDLSHAIRQLAVR